MSVNQNASGGVVVSDDPVVIPPVPVQSVFGRTGNVVAQAGDYTSTLVDNSSGVAGANVTAALNALATAIAALVTGVSSVFGRTGAVVAQANDYTATQVAQGTATTVLGTTVQNAISNLLRATWTSSASTTKTIASTDFYKNTRMTSATAIAISVDSDANVPNNLGDWFIVWATGGGQITVTGINGASFIGYPLVGGTAKTIATGSALVFQKTDVANQWAVTGGLASV